MQNLEWEIEINQFSQQQILWSQFKLTKFKIFPPGKSKGWELRVIDNYTGNILKSFYIEERDHALALSNKIAYQLNLGNDLSTVLNRLS